MGAVCFGMRGMQRYEVPPCWEHAAPWRRPSPGPVFLHTPVGRRGMDPLWEWLEAGLWHCWEREGSFCLAVLHGGMSWGWPSAVWSCLFGHQAASFLKSKVGLLAALLKQFKASETQMAGSRAQGFRTLGELNLKATSAPSPLDHWGLIHYCSGVLKMHMAAGLRVYLWVCAGNVLSLMFLSARVQKLLNESFAQRKGYHTEKIWF